MRKTFANVLAQEMQKDKDIFLLVADLGYGVFDELQKKTENYYNVGAAEQLMICLATGLALSNKIPICYSITSFLLYRPFEMIRNYMNGDKICIKLVGTGRNKEYTHDGLSHWCEDEERALALFPNIAVLRPNTKDEVIPMTIELLYNNKPTFLSLSRY